MSIGARVIVAALLCMAPALASQHASYQHSAPTDRVHKCEDVYAAATADSTTTAQICSAMRDAYFCIFNVMDDFPANREVAGLAAQFLDASLTLNQTECDLSEQTFPTQFRDHYGNLVIHTDTSKSFKLFRDTTASDLFDLVAPLTKAETDHRTADKATQGVLPPFKEQARVDGRATLLGQSIVPSIDVGAKASGIGRIRALLNSVQRSVSNEIPPTISSMQSELSARIVAQANARTVVNSNLNSLPPLYTSKIASITSAALATHDQIKIDMSNTRVSLAARLSTQLSAALAAEVSREVPYPITQSTQVASISTAHSASLSAALKAQSSTADANCAASVGAVSVNMPTATGSTDYQACSTVGQLYYSSTNKQVFICRGGVFAPTQYLTNPPFQGSTALTAVQIATITSGTSARLLDTTWNMCYRASTHGWTPTYFHYYCDYRGPTTVIYKSGTRVWGGFIDRPWRSSNTYQQSYVSFLWRINPTSGAMDRVDISSYGNAIYDYSSYCGAWGGGHDMMVSGSCQNGYTSPNSYVLASGSTGPYDQNFLAGSYSSWTLSELEVWYRT